ncbi:MAG: putative ABC transporter permease, partial [Clostridiales bacterium]|nr:putative ABC transporter permease [Clostridiales bacterium]
FHMRWWDYSEYKLNFHGYICLRFYIYWGIACSLGLYVLHPAVFWVVNNVPYIAKVIVVSVFTLLMIIDIITTIGTIIGFRKKLAAFARVTSGVKVVSDKIGEQIYSGVDTVVTVSEPTKRHYDEYRKLVLENRKAERELAATHRAEEKAFAEQFTAAEMESIRLAKKAAAGARDTFIHSFKYSEQRILAIVSNVSDLPSSALGRLKKLVRYKEHGIYSEEQTDIPEIDIEQDPLDSAGL